MRSVRHNKFFVEVRPVVLNADLLFLTYMPQALSLLPYAINSKI